MHEMKKYSLVTKKYGLMVKKEGSLGEAAES